MTQRELVEPRALCALTGMTRPEYVAGSQAEPWALNLAESEAVIAIVQDVVAGHAETELERMLAQRLSPAMKIYIAEGVKDEETL